MRAAVCFKVTPVRDGAREFKRHCASERETQHSEPRWIGMLSESRVGEHGIEREFYLERPEKQARLAFKRTLKRCYHNVTRSGEEGRQFA